MYQENDSIFYNDSQILRVNCTDEQNQKLSISDIVEKIQSYPCDSSSWHGGLTYLINNCHFTFNEFKPIIDSIIQRFLECKDQILNILSNQGHYFSYLDFSNDAKNSNASLGNDGVSYAVSNVFNVLKEFNNNSPNTTDIFINFSNNGVMINETKKLLKDCASMVAEYVNVPMAIIDREFFPVKDHNIIDNYFHIKGNSSGVYGTECLFDTNNCNEIQTSILTASVEGISILPVIAIGVFIATVIGVTYIHNNSFNPHNENYQNVGTKLEVYSKVEIAGDIATEYQDII